MKVLHIIDSFVVGGAETLLRNSIEVYQQRYPQVSHEVVAVFEGGPLGEEFEKLAVCHYLNASLKTLPLKLLKLHSLIRQLGVNLVHSHLYLSTLVTRMALPASVPLVSTYHTGFHDPSSIEFSKKRLWADRLTYRSQYYTIYVSEAVKAAIAPALKIDSRHAVLPNFVHQRFRPLYTFKEGNGLRLVSVGNYREQKNHSLAIEALALLPAHAGVSLDIYGSGTLENQLLEQIRQRGVAVNLKGKTSITSELLSQYDAFLMTSKHEGMPLALLEAMVSGLPSFLNDLPELRETAGSAALFFQRNSAEALAQVLLQLCENKAALKPLAQAARTEAKKFVASTYVDALQNIYQSLR